MIITWLKRIAIVAVIIAVASWIISNQAEFKSLIDWVGAEGGKIVNAIIIFIKDIIGAFK